jgi:tetratricopeptide (TPR) repeat protein
MKRPVVGLLALLALATCAPPEPSLPELAPLPVGLEEGEPAIRRDLEQRYAAVESALNATPASPAAVAARLGDLAISLLAHSYFAEAGAAFDQARRAAPDEFAWHYYYGHAVRRTGDMDSAASGFWDALAVDPASLPARLWWAETRLHREALDDAEEGFSRALEQDPHCAQAMTGLGRIALSRGDFDAAVTNLRAALEHRSDSPPARYALALALRGQGHLDEARAELEQLAGQNYSLIITCFEDPLMQEVRHRQTGTRAHEGRAIRAREEGLAATALVELQAAVRSNPHRYPARLDIAGLLLQFGRRDEAIAELETLLEIRPDYSAALALLAQLAAEDGDQERSNELMARAIAADPESEDVHRAHGDLARQAGRLEEALAAYDRALEIEPALLAAIVGKAACLAGLGQFDAASHLLAERRRSLPGKTALVLAEAQLLLSRPDPADAAEALALAREANGPPSIASIDVFALALARNGEFEEAAEWQRRLLEALPPSGVWASRHQEMSGRLERFEHRQPVAASIDVALLTTDSFFQPLTAEAGALDNRASDPQTIRGSASHDG